MGRSTDDPPRIKLNKTWVENACGNPWIYTGKTDRGSCGASACQHVCVIATAGRERKHCDPMGGWVQRT
jgi:hypothetical protein